METATKQIPRMKIATVYGVVEVACDEFLGRAIVVTTEPHTLIIDGEELLLPAGTFFLCNRGLARRTESRPEGKAEYELVRSIYDLWRLCDHVKRGTRTEARELIPYMREIRGCAEAMLVGGILEPDEHEQIRLMLLLTAEEFREPKRAPRKTRTAVHLQKASMLNFESLDDARKIAPSSMVAYAACYQVDRRIQDVWSVNGYFNTRSVRAYFHIRRVHEIVEQFWRFLCGKSRTPRRGLMQKMSEMRELFHLLADSHRGKNALVLLYKRLIARRGAFLGIAIQPYTGLAEAVVARIERLAFSAEAGDRERMKKIGRELRRILRRMRLIHHLETRVISPIAVYVQRVPARKRVADAPLLRMFLARLHQATGRVRTFTSREMHPELKSAFLVSVTASERAFVEGDFVRAKEYIKDATRMLADVSVGRGENKN